MSHDRPNPKIDFMFRKLFGSEENKDLLVSLLNSVVEPTPPIVDVSIKNPFNLASYPGDKESILDIRAVDENGTWYDIEMQVEAHSLYGRRAVYYLAKTYADQRDSGEDYSHLNTVIGIHFLDFRYFKDERVLRQFVFKDVQTNDAPSELGIVRLYFIEMPKFAKGWAEVRTALDRRVAFLNRVGLDQEVLPEQLTQDPAVARAVVQLERAGLSAAEREVYEGEARKKMVDAIQLRDAEQRGDQRGEERGIRIGTEQGIQIGTEQGIQIGTEQGIQIGTEQGIQIGTEHGIEQGQRRLLLKQMARRLGEVPSSIVSRMEGLRADVLEDLGVSLPDLPKIAEGPLIYQWGWIAIP